MPPSAYMHGLGGLTSAPVAPPSAYNVRERPLSPYGSRPTTSFGNDYSTAYTSNTHALGALTKPLARPTSPMPAQSSAYTTYPYSGASASYGGTGAPYSGGNMSYGVSTPPIPRPPTGAALADYASPRLSSRLYQGYDAAGAARAGSPSPYANDYAAILPARSAFKSTFQPEHPTAAPVGALAAGSVAPPQSSADHGKYSVVFDLDETLVYAREGTVKARPGSSELLRSLSGSCEVMVWTSSEKNYAANAMRHIDAGRVVKHTIARDTGGWFSGDRCCAKNLRLLGRDLSKTLLVENTPDCIKENSDNAILLPDFVGGSDSGALSTLQTVLRELQASGKSVPEYLSTSPHLTKRTVTCQSGAAITCYTLQNHAPSAGPQPVARGVQSYAAPPQSYGGYQGAAAFGGMPTPRSPVASSYASVRSYGLGY